MTMKCIYLLLLTLCTGQAMSQLTDTEFGRLVELGELYSRNQNFYDTTFAEQAEEIRIEKFGHITDVLITLSQKDSSILSNSLLKRPSNEELKYWYVIRDIHYNLVDTDNAPRKTVDVARESLIKEVDEKWMLYSYYYQIHSGLSFAFNEVDFSKLDITIERYDLKNDVEKGIFYLNVMQSFLTRFRVLNMLGNAEAILEFAAKMPKVNGESYYNYTNFDFEDFKIDFAGEGKESFLKRELGAVYAGIFSHFIALVDQGKMDQARRLYSNSILSKKAYFKYSADKKDLKKIWKGGR